MNAPKASWITMHATHKNAHAEELAIIWVMVAEHFKPSVREHYLNADRAGFVRWDNLPEGTTREHWEARGYKFYGRWGGEFDEHATPGSARKEGESALSLVARKLGLLERYPKFRPIFGSISLLDLDLGESLYQFPALVKMMNDLGRNPEETMRWSFIAFEAMYASSPEIFESISSEAGTCWGEFVSQWLSSRFSYRASLKDLDTIAERKNPFTTAAILKVQRTPALQRIFEFTRKWSQQNAGDVLEPHVIVEAIRRKFGEQIAKDWAFMALDAMHEQSKNFLQTVEDYRKAEKYIGLSWRGRKINVVVGKSDSLQFSRYARSAKKDGGCWAAIVVCQNSRGNVGIFTNSNLRINLSKAIVLLRMAELEKKGRKFFGSPSILCGEAEVCDGDVWYFFEKGHMILNGSTTRTVPPTVLSLEAVVNALFVGVGIESLRPGEKSAALTVPMAAIQQPVSVPAMG